MGAELRAGYIPRASQSSGLRNIPSEHVYMSIYIYTYVMSNMYMYIYRERESERKGWVVIGAVWLQIFS